MKVRNKQTYAMLTVFVAILAAVGFCIVYTNNVDKQTRHSFCDIVVTVSDYYRANPAVVKQSPLGAKVATEYEKLRTDLGCDGK
jgi:hypothetical protein